MDKKTISDLAIMMKLLRAIKTETGKAPKNISPAGLHLQAQYVIMAIWISA